MLVTCLMVELSLCEFIAPLGVPVGGVRRDPHKPAANELSSIKAKNLRKDIIILTNCIGIGDGCIILHFDSVWSHDIIL